MFLAQIAEEEFAKWKFAFVALGRPEYLADSDTITDRFAISKREWGGQWENYLGLEHEDKEKRRPASNHNTRYNYEKPVKIHG
jgi:ubiquitin carboxyl-terminal hydrolase 7